MWQVEALIYVSWNQEEENFVEIKLLMTVNLSKTTLMRRFLCSWNQNKLIVEFSGM